MLNKIFCRVSTYIFRYLAHLSLIEPFCASFLLSPGQGALGSLDFTKDERRALAARANKEPPTFGSLDRQRLIDNMHQRMQERMTAEAEAKAATAVTKIASPTSELKVQK